jgi:predicted dehydrogenase
VTEAAPSLRVGVIGLGDVLDAHLAGLTRAGARITAACDIRGSRAAEVAAAHHADAFQHYDELLASGLVDAVDILLPHHLHEEVAAAALSADVHVLIEKPAARSAAAVRRLRDLADSHGRVFAVAENTRLVDAYEAVGRLLKSGSLGEVEVVRTLICGNDAKSLSNANDWRGRKELAIGGALFDGGAHSFYLLEWLFGGAATVLATTSTRTAGCEVEDFALATGRLRDGGSYVTEYFFAVEVPWTERLEVYGSRGSCVVDQLMSPPVVHIRDSHDVVGAPIEKVDHDPTGWKAKSIAAVAADFVDSVTSRRDPCVELDHIARAAASIEGAYQSALNGGEVPLEIA